MKIENFKLKIILCFFTIALCLMLSVTAISAASSYVLPYPSPMPGSFLYKIRLISEKIQKYWYFGNFGQFKYNLMESDKYLVEAKTLFEYRQYLLGSQALRKSDRYFLNTLLYLPKAKKEGKNIVQKQNLLKDAVLKHVEVLSVMNKKSPETFVWSPEKSSPTVLSLKKLIKDSISIRKKYL